VPQFLPNARLSARRNVTVATFFLLMLSFVVKLSDVSLSTRLGVLETWCLVSRRLDTRFYKSRLLNLGVLNLGTSESWSWNPRVSVLVLGPWRLGLRHSWSEKLRQKSWVEVAQIVTFEVLHPLLEKVFCPPATSAPVERIFSHSSLLMRTNRARMGDNMLSQLVYLRCNSKL